MIWPRKQINSVIFAVIAIWLAGCGVKGDPLPPEKPAELGRGRPTYKRATEEIQIEKARKTPQILNDKDDSDDDDKDE